MSLLIFPTADRRATVPLRQLVLLALTSSLEALIYQGKIGVSFEALVDSQGHDILKM